MSFSAANLLHTLSRLTRPSGYLVGFSGGMDSHVLLHALASLIDRLSIPVRAIHVDHGLQAQSDAWSRHCASVCRQLRIPFETFHLKLKPIKGESLEALAREARYDLLARELRSGEMLLTAHHQDDQAETLLLQLLRGAGLSGLAAMPELTRFGKGQHARPLLDYSRDALLHYATEAGLRWIEDDSNQNTAFDRNYLRHQVVPLLKCRWPAMASTLSRTARHCAEADRLIDTLLSQTLEQMHDSLECSLPVPKLKVLPSDQLAPLLRLWIRRSGFRIPASTVLRRIINEVLDARPDATPLVSWSGAEIRRYRDRLYLMSTLPSFDPSQVIDWTGERELLLPADLGKLHFQKTREMALSGPSPGRYRIVFRQGGEVCRPLGRGVRKTVKQLMQEAGVLPWMRGRIPLLEIDGEIAAVIGICCCAPAEQDPVFQWTTITWDMPQPWALPEKSNESD